MWAFKKARKAKAIMKGNNMIGEMKAIMKHHWLTALWLSCGGWVVAISIYFYAQGDYILTLAAMTLMLSWPVISLVAQTVRALENLRFRALRSGLKGERFVCSVLLELGDDFDVYNQVYLPNKRSRTGHTECDFLVVGQKAFYLVETKNNSGIINATEKGTTWKINYLGNANEFEMRNAASQVEIQGKVLNSWLLSVGVKNPLIVPVVGFSNPAAQVMGTHNVSTPIFDYPMSSLLSRIEDYELALADRPDIDKEFIASQINC